MSRQQWGHGFHAGVSASRIKIQLEGPFPVGFFFHIVGKDGKFERQGVVTGKSGDVLIARCFSWIDGSISNAVWPFKAEDHDIVWYQTAKHMRYDFYEQAGWDEATIHSAEMMAEL